MKPVITCVFLLCLYAGTSQTVSDPSTFAAGIIEENLRKHLTIIAGPEMEGRETASEGQRKAEAYLEQQFRTIGLLPGWNSGFVQLFPVYQDSLLKATLSVDGEKLRNDTDFVVSANSGFNVSFMASEVLFVGYGRSDSIRDDYENVNARGKIVMVLPGSATITHKGKKVREPIPDFRVLQRAAHKNGAIAMLIVDKQFPRPPGNAKGSLYVQGTRENIPNTFFISDSVARRIMGSDYDIARKIMKKGPPPPKSCYVSVLFELDKTTMRHESSNVIGILEGTDKKEECIVISAHYDHLGKRDSIIYYGADDDGSGTVTILEIARAFKNAAMGGAGPRRSIIFLAVSGEENGLWGSSYYAENPAMPLENTSANLNIDMIGRIEKDRKKDSGNYIYVVGDNRLSSELRLISEEANSLSSNLRLDYRFNDPEDPQRIFYRSDHYNFVKKGVPAIFYFSGLHEDYHRPSDTVDKIRFDLLAKRARLIFHTAWELANRDNLLQRDIE